MGKIATFEKSRFRLSRPPPSTTRPSLPRRESGQNSRLSRELRPHHPANVTGSVTNAMTRDDTGRRRRDSRARAADRLGDWTFLRTGLRRYRAIRRLEHSRKCKTPPEVPKRKRPAVLVSLEAHVKNLVPRSSSTSDAPVVISVFDKLGDRVQVPCRAPAWLSCCMRTGATHARLLGWNPQPRAFRGGGERLAGSMQHLPLRRDRTTPFMVVVPLRGIGR